MFETILLTIVLFCCYNCNGVPGAMMRQDIDQIIYNYVQPLSEKFPNHELEVQFELRGPAHQFYQQRLARRKAYLHKPYNMFVREGTKTEDKPKPEALTPSTKTAPAHPTNRPRTRTTTLQKPKTESSRQLVYKDEMQKALDDLERKLNEKKLALKTRPEGPQEESAQLIISNPGPVSGGATSENINRIIELLKKGIHLQRHLPIVGDDGNMEWMQIKIPKN